MPLKSRGKVLGAIRLVAAGSDSSFNQDDVRLAEDLARRAAAAIENAQLHRAVLDQKDRLSLAHSAARMGTWHWDLLKQHMSGRTSSGSSTESCHNGASTAGTGTGLIHPDDFDEVLRESECDARLRCRVPVGGAPRGGRRRARLLGPLARPHRARRRRQTDCDLGITMDVTDRHHAEDALRRTEKLAAAGRLAATVAHEINNPLESIVNLVYLSRHTPGLPRGGGRLPGDGGRGADAHCADRPPDAGLLSRVGGSAHQQYLPDRVPRHSMSYRQRIQGRLLDCETDFDTEFCACVIPGELKQVVANLIANAIDATDPGGRIQVSVKRGGEGAAITVADNGTGIEEAHRARLFEPFFTTKADVGTGLGLWVTKGIVEKQRGTISVSSSTDLAAHGTAITVTLPLD